MSIIFPNESLNYRTARDALLQREVHLRREMESVAAELRALPPGGEVPEDYLFDCIGEGGAPATIPMTGLFRGGDTLMLYHSCSRAMRRILGRVLRVELPPSCRSMRGRARPALRLLICGKAQCPILKGWAAISRWSPRPPSNRSRRSRAIRGGSISDCCRPRTTASGAIMEAMVRMASLCSYCDRL